MVGLAAKLLGFPGSRPGNARPTRHLSSVGGALPSQPFADIRPIPPPSLMVKSVH